MARRKVEEKKRAIKMRLNGASYSQIQKEVKVSKSTLSYWLRDYPLSEKRIKQLRDNNPRRIEKFRETMRRKREKKLAVAYQEAKRDIGKLNKREKFLAGLFLYWGEGAKTSEAEVSLSNTDAKMVQFFIKWLEGLGAKRDSLRVRLHLYSDMDRKKEEDWWSRQLSVPLHQFRKPYIKKSRRCDITWNNPSEHGTCNVMYGDKKLHDYVLMSIKHLQDKMPRL